MCRVEARLDPWTDLSPDRQRSGGTRLAHLIVKPAIVSFFDASLDGAELQLDQASLADGSRMAGRTLGEADIRGPLGLSVVAVQRAGQVVPEPAPDFTLHAGDVLVVFGHRDQIGKLDGECGNT